MLDFDAFDSMGQSSSSSISKTRGTVVSFAHPEDGVPNHGLRRTGNRRSNNHYINDDMLQGTEELLNDYITTLVVQLLTVSFDIFLCFLIG